MKRKDDTVETEFHPTLNFFLTWVDEIYGQWGDQAVITSGSEATVKHSRTSLHYSGCAADIRIWERNRVPDVTKQVARLKELVIEFCRFKAIPTNWIDIVLESDHIHIEYQPKRQDDLIR